MMENILALSSNAGRGERKRNFLKPSIFNLIAEVGLNFFRFLVSHGISGEQNLVVLSSKDNYSCDEQELKDARIIVNLKRLNLIKHLDLFLNSLVRILPPNTSFIGYFSDDKTVTRNGFNSVSIWRFINRLYNLSGTRKNHNMNRNEVRELLEKNGFITLNMKEMNGYTYFISQNIGRTV